LIKPTRVYIRWSPRLLVMSTTRSAIKGQQDKQYTYIVTLWRVRATIVPVEEKRAFHNFDCVYM